MKRNRIFMISLDLDAYVQTPMASIKYDTDWDGNWIWTELEIEIKSYQQSYHNLKNIGYDLFEFENVL